MVSPVPEDPSHVHVVLRFMAPNEHGFGGDVVQLSVPRRAYDGRSRDVTLEDFYDDFLEAFGQFLRKDKYHVHIRELGPGWYAIGDVDHAQHDALKAGIIAAGQEIADSPKYQHAGGYTIPRQCTRM